MHEFLSLGLDTEIDVGSQPERMLSKHFEVVGSKHGSQGTSETISSSNRQTFVTVQNPESDLLFSG